MIINMFINIYKHINVILFILLHININTYFKALSMLYFFYKII